MFGRNQVSDRDLLKTINQRITRTGTASSTKVNVIVQQGNVTLTGTLQYAMQRDSIVKAVTRVAGVRRVNDQMQHVVKKRHDATPSNHGADRARFSGSQDESATTDDSPDNEDAPTDDVIVVPKRVEEPLPDQPRLE